MGEKQQRRYSCGPHVANRKTEAEPAVPRAIPTSLLPRVPNTRKMSCIWLFFLLFPVFCPAGQISLKAFIELICLLRKTVKLASLVLSLSRISVFPLRFISDLNQSTSNFLPGMSGEGIQRFGRFIIHVLYSVSPPCIPLMVQCWVQGL